ncbi:sugar ABC transporter permease [Asanoa ishikariensis]|uniref:Autoinducer 2 import system permease protein LsrD n=1 Tax=Asanoa ishikariensis TaxID=137265 RepID=A0A1H3T2U3_9ACTN|nr:ABC transporter permease [Asanoa ishikariensis]GIF63072.1 sugar ABC transporter permease [Asanoa ishikariensis]SDZ44562.1 monosaccharide ABC transporter membrane protein, CUT2 family [Asanoa ishikariensis]
MAVDTPVREPVTPPSRTRARGVLGSWDLLVLVALIAVIVVGSLTIDGVGNPRFYRFVILEAIPIALIALPMTLIVITGEIDLSVASTVGLTCSVMGWLWQAGVTSLPLLIAISLALGAVLGAVNGIFVTVFGLPSLAVTIGTLALYRGLAYVVLGDKAVADYPISWTTNMIAPIPGTVVPWFVLVVAVLALLFGVLLHATPIGRGLYAIGNNAEASAYSGIAVLKTKFWLFVATGMVAALAGVFWTFRFASARADNANGLELSVVAAVLLGGVSIFGGRGGLLGVVAAVALLGTLRNALQLADVPANALTIVTGTLLIASVVGPNVVRMARGRLRRRPPPGERTQP